MNSQRHFVDEGWIYVATNPSVPGLVKIGRTTRDVSQRLKDFTQAGAALSVQKGVCGMGGMPPKN